MPLTSPLTALRLDPIAFDPDRDDREQLEIAHELTRYHRATIARRGRRIAHFLQDPKAIAEGATPAPAAFGQTVIALPDADLPGTRLDHVLAARTSARRPSLAGSLSLTQLSALLSLAARANRVVPAPNLPDVAFHFRPYPSAGGLYPCDIHLVCADVTGLASGAYRYDAQDHRLVRTGTDAVDFNACEMAPQTTPPPCAIVVTGVLDRSTVKYGARGYRFAMLEAGHIGQNLVLAATALALPSLVYGSFCDSELERLLGLDGVNEVVLSVILVGSGVA